MVHQLHEAAASKKVAQSNAASALWRIDVVCQRTGLSKTSVYALMRDQRFPASVPLMGKTVAWDSRGVQAWIDERISMARRVGGAA